MVAVVTSMNATPTVINNMMLGSMSWKICNEIHIYWKEKKIFEVMNIKKNQQCRLDTKYNLPFKLYHEDTDEKMHLFFGVPD